jgi:hypothetical protein
MKIRKGFVSNSSTCNYTVIIDKSEHDKIIDSLHPFVRHLLHMMHAKEKKLHNQDVVVVQWVEGNEDMWEDVYADSDLQQEYCKDQNVPDAYDGTSSSRRIKQHALDTYVTAAEKVNVLKLLTED